MLEVEEASVQRNPIYADKGVFIFYFLFFYCGGYDLKTEMGFICFFWQMTDCDNLVPNLFL